MKEPEGARWATTSPTEEREDSEEGETGSETRDLDLTGYLAAIIAVIEVIFWPLFVVFGILLITVLFFFFLV